MKTKELLTVEFRYVDAPEGYFDKTKDVSKTVTIGIYDTLNDAVDAGNEILKKLSKYFEVRSDDQFKTKCPWRLSGRLVTNICYPTKGVSYFAKITKLSFDDLETTVLEAFQGAERHRKYKLSQENE